MTAIRIDADIAEEAADWLLRLQDGALNDADRGAFSAWLARSPMHATAWQRAEQLLNLNATAPAGLGRDALQRLRSLNRRQALRSLAGLLAAAPLSWHIAQQLPQWSATHRSARGERRLVTLADGSRVMLNSASALDVHYDVTQRRLHLIDGEILITTNTDTASPPRPFLVQTAQGRVRALGTRFSVRTFDDHTHIAVFEHAVEVTAADGSTRQLQAGQQADFDADSIGDAIAVPATAAAWENGFFVANRLRLADLVTELGRHRSGVLRCHADVADMPVSGTFPIGNDDRALALLENTLPLRIDRRSRYWVTVRAQ